MGRAAGYVLDQDEGHRTPDPYFVYADKVKKVRALWKWTVLMRNAPEESKIEKERKEYYKYFTGSEWHSMKNYDLPINTTKLDSGGAAGADQGLYQAERIYGLTGEDSTVS